MQALHAIAVREWMGMPVYVWAIIVAVGAVNEAIVRSKWTAAQSLLQGAARAILKVPAIGALLGRFWVLGWVLRRAAGLDEAGQPVAGPEDASAR